MFTFDIDMKELINKLKKLLKGSSGFTLIELLVVIGILGVLAAALVATIDPFEQLKKANDAKIKNIVVEFENANVRYFTTHTSFPWSDGTSSNANCTNLGSATFLAQPLNTTPGMLDCLGAPLTNGSLIAEGELKASFTTNLNDLKQVLVTWDHGNPQALTVCFGPTSKSQKASGETIYHNDGSPNTDSGVCPNANALDGVCFWCTK